MNVNGKHYRTIWLNDNKKMVRIIEQRWLPKFFIRNLYSYGEMCVAIKKMSVRGAGLIGAAAGYGMYLGALEVGSCNFTAETFDNFMKMIGKDLKNARPTAVNLEWAVERQLTEMKKFDTVKGKIEAALKTANLIADEDAEYCRRIGEHGVKLIEATRDWRVNNKKDETVNILTHCNAGWLAFVDYGSATAPIYAAHDKGIKVHVWVDETRPWNQGSRLTAWELGQHGVPHTVIADNVGGHLMQHGMVDMVIVGTDRTTYTGDVCNKVGTYLKALAAKDNNVPFYVALPSSTFDWEMQDGVREIPIEQRGGEEVKYAQGLHDNEIKKVLLMPEDSPVANYAFDVTPREYVTGLITERGVCKASEEGVLGLYPEKKKD